MMAKTLVTGGAGFIGSPIAAVRQWIKANLPPGEPLITTQANTLNYVSGHPALALPSIQDVTMLR